MSTELTFCTVCGAVVMSWQQRCPRCEEPNPTYIPDTPAEDDIDPEKGKGDL